MPRPTQKRPGHVFIIHLERQRERLANVNWLVGQVGGPATVLSAVDAQSLGSAEIERHYCRKLHRPRFPFTLRKAEIACFLSHREAWRRIVEGGYEHAVVVEDDVRIDPNRFRLMSELAATHARDGDFIRFPVKDREEPATVVASSGGLQLFIPRNVGLNCHAQLVTRGAATRLLEATERFDRPVDAFLQMTWISGLWPLCSTAGIAQEISDQLGGSAVKGQVGSTEWLARAVKRAIYRLDIRRRQARVVSEIRLTA